MSTLSNNKQELLDQSNEVQMGCRHQNWGQYEWFKPTNLNKFEQKK